MPIVRIPGAGQAGVIKDLSQHELPLAMRLLECVITRFRFTVGRVSLFSSVKKAEVNVLLIEGDMRPPFLAKFMPINSYVPRRIVRLDPHILVILCMSAFAQIAKSIVGSVTIDMVNISLRERAINMCPHKSMRQEFSSENADLNISGLHQFPVWLSNKRFLPIDFPSKQSGFWVVIERFAQSIDVDGFVHFQSPLIEKLCEGLHGNWHRNQLSGATLATQGAV